MPSEYHKHCLCPAHGSTGDHCAPTCICCLIYANIKAQSLHLRKDKLQNHVAYSSGHDFDSKLY